MDGKPVAIVAMLGLLAYAGVVSAQLNRAPKELEDVGVEEHFDTQIPLDTPFIDSGGNKVTIGQLFDGTRPVVLTLNYSDCPMLCILQLNGLTDGMKRAPLELSTEYQVITISIDPLESPERAQLTKQKYLKLYGRPGGSEGWHFLTGRESDIQRVAKAVGFHYKYVPETKQFAHAAVAMICTPEGRVSKYLYGIEYDPQTLRFSLLEAAEGKIGSTVDRFLLYCFHYDATSGRYGPAAFRIMQLGGVLTLVVLGSVLSFYWLRESHKKKAKPEEKTS
ncbi:MAG: SCO family protein [Thermoguttaceae bacterium]